MPRCCLCCSRTGLSAWRLPSSLSVQTPNPRSKGAVAGVQRRGLSVPGPGHPHLQPRLQKRKKNSTSPMVSSWQKEKRFRLRTGPLKRFASSWVLTGSSRHRPLAGAGMTKRKKWDSWIPLPSPIPLRTKVHRKGVRMAIIRTRKMSRATKRRLIKSGWLRDFRKKPRLKCFHLKSTVRTAAQFESLS